MSKTVVILGGAYVGMQVAHYILKQKIKDVKVILVTKVRMGLPSRELFRPPCATRQPYQPKGEVLTTAAELSFLLEHGLHPSHYPGCPQG